MTKKIFIITIMLLLCININVYAGDMPESIMLGEQKALFIGKIASISSDTYNIIPSTVMMGNIQQSEIQIKKFGKYYGINNKPKVGDFIVAVLLDEDKIDDTWVFKSTSDDYKTLKLISESYDMVVRYEKYINEGKYFEAQKRIDENNKVSITSTNVNVNSTGTMLNNKKQSFLTNKKLISILIIVVSGIICFFIFRFKKSHISYID